MSTPSKELEPRFENGKPLRIVGLREQYTPETMSGIPAQWQRFMPRIGKVPGQAGRTAYGVCFPRNGGIAYLTGVDVSGTGEVPGDLATASIPPQKYAVFSHRGHVSKLYETLDALEQGWRPEWGTRSGGKSAEAPLFFERYGEGFDPKTGIGDIEVWVPVKA